MDWNQQWNTTVSLANQGGSRMSNGKPVDHPSRETVKVRQGTGPRATVSVLLISLMLTALAGVALLAYFYYGPTPIPKV
jgi:hypothetical protein